MSDPGVVWRGEQPEPGLGAGQPQPPQRRQQPRQREQARPVARPGTQHRAQQGAVTGEEVALLPDILMISFKL